MTRDQIQAAVAAELLRIVPDASIGSLGADEDLRDALELDSMDLRSLVIGLKRRLGVDVPEADVPRLLTLRGATDYLAAHLPG
jgi:acyl carrier protein